MIRFINCIRRRTDLTEVEFRQFWDSDEFADLIGRMARTIGAEHYQYKRTLLVDLDTVCCIKAEGHYSTLFTETERYLCNLSLSDLENRIDDRLFVRVHRSYIVNMRCAKAFEKSEEQCHLLLDHRDGLKIPVSKRHIALLKDLLGLH